MFPITRLRRGRSSGSMRRMLTETRLHRDDLVLPLFFDETISSVRYAASMPGVPVYPVRDAEKVAERIHAEGINAVLLFGIPRHKDGNGSGAYARDGVVQKAIKRFGTRSDALIIADVCVCGYTGHGHCGIFSHGDVDNDPTAELCGRIAASLADAGADVVAPSGMMDGQVAAVRGALDDAGHRNTPIMAYSAKFCSSFYGPFRDIADSAPSSGGRETYQMNPANAREAMREISSDIGEGADIVMIKPAMPCLDVIHNARNRFNVPIAAYQVSGEYAMIRAAAENGWLDGRAAMTESLISMKRAGADILITYFAEEAAKEMEQ